MYGNLRSAIELLIEEIILNNTIKRHRYNIAVTSFFKIKFQVINEIKLELEQLFDRCCRFIEGHSNPETYENSPTKEEFEQDYLKFIQVWKKFTQ